MNNSAFFENEVPEKIKQLKKEMQPTWGSMNADQMVDHLRAAVILSMENFDDEITTPEAQLPAYKKFLMSDRPFGQNLPKPAAFDRIASSARDIDDKKEQLLESLQRMKLYFEENPEHTAVHSSFGRLNTEEWWQLHRKHFTHHFTQFGLL